MFFPIVKAKENLSHFVLRVTKPNKYKPKDKEINHVDFHASCLL